ncbi:MAG: OmpA family protein [Saprospiraceae bacterium]
MMRRNLLLIFIAFVFGQSGFTQPNSNENYVTRKTASEKLKKTYKKGIKYSRAGENEKALKEFSKALKKEPAFIDAQIQWSAIHYDMKNYEVAVQGFEKVIQIDSFYKKKVFYTLALAEMRMKKFDEAIIHFENYLASQPNNEILQKKSKKHIANSRFMKTAYANPVPYEPKSLGENINTQNPEYLPSLTADGNQLIYTARLYGQEDFIMSTKKDGVWQKGVPLNGVNTEQNEGAQSISADGKFLVFTACNRKDGYGSCDLYYSEIRDGRWTSAANIGSPINSRGWESQPSISADGRAIYFTSNRKGGQGGKDIWISYRQKDGKWGKPQNLGDIINSPYDEQSPFIHADNQTLYFMSDGHPGMGGHDLFFARKKNEKEWFTPKNLGYPINTEAGEGALVLSLDGKTGYFASDTKNVKTDESVFDSGVKGGHTDLYSFELYQEARPQPVTYVQAYVYDLETKEKLSAKVDFIDLNSGDTYASSFTDQDGEFLVCLPIGKNYALNISKEKYLFHSENFSLEKTQSLNNPFLLKIGLQPIKNKPVTSTVEPETTSPPVVLRNVLFETGSAELKPESLFELNQLLQLLENNNTLKIQINGHTDNVGSDDNNLTLSTNRAKAVKDFLIKNGIAASRLSHKGYGETKPIDSNDVEWGRQNNRRTEFVMLK